ncbi:hypothetical protein MMC18_004610 [Xylographa bjoerkii]|nr:hypothetical protein [Xylographa bjoerkii]
MFAPGAKALVIEFDITDSVIAALTVSIYVLGFALGPLSISPMSEIYGRLIVYHLCNAAYIVFTIGCALSTNTAMFLVFRFICGCVSPMAIRGRTIADLHPPEERGKAMALLGLGPLLGPAGVVSLLAVPLMRETYEPVLLDRKAARLRKATGFWPAPSSVAYQDPPLLAHCPPPLHLRGVHVRPHLPPLHHLPLRLRGDLRFRPQHRRTRHLGLGLGMLFAMGLFAVLSDKLLHQPRGGTVARPELRLLLMMWCTPTIPIGFFWYGWSAAQHTHWIVEILGTFVIGLGSFLIMMPAQIYLVDAFGPEAAASALAANTVLRNMSGAFLPLAGTPLYTRLGLGWGNSVLAFVGLAFAPVPFLFYRYGERLEDAVCGGTPD